MDLFTKEGGRQRDIVCYSHDKPRHTARVVQIMEGKMVSIRCAHRDIALYPLAEVNILQYGRCLQCSDLIMDP